MIALLVGCRAKNTWIDRLRDINMAIYMLTDRSCVADCCVYYFVNMTSGIRNGCCDKLYKSGLVWKPG